MIRRPVSARHRSTRGSSLLEVLVALLLFSLGILGLVGLQSRAMQISYDAEDRSRAATMAQELISTMWTQKTLSLPSGTITAWQSRLTNTRVSGLPSATGTVTVSADPVSGAASYAQIKITWRSPARLSTDANSTYVTQVSMP